MWGWKKDWYKQHPEKNKEESRKRRIRQTTAKGFHTEQEWQQKKKEFCYRCAYCGIHESLLKNKYKDKRWWKLTEDHIQAITKGGSDYITNIIPACVSCNSSKNNKTYEFSIKNK